MFLALRLEFILGSKSFRIQRDIPAFFSCSTFSRYKMVPHWGSVFGGGLKPSRMRAGALVHPTQQTLVEGVPLSPLSR